MTEYISKDECCAYRGELKNELTGVDNIMYCKIDALDKKVTDSNISIESIENKIIKLETSIPAGLNRILFALLGIFGSIIVGLMIFLVTGK